MTTFKYISTYLFLLVILSYCSSVSGQAKQSMTNSTEMLVSRYKANVNNCTIDTVAILANSNLPGLLKELENTKLSIFKKKNAIPDFIMTFLRCQKYGKFTIANPDEKWQATDVIAEPNLPDRKLIFFAISDSMALMTHLTVGIGESEHILIFKFHGKVISDFWCGNVLADLLNKGEVINYIKKNINKHWGLNTNTLYF